MDVNNHMFELIENNLVVFKPIAYYDKHLDCIRVQLKDCSFYEDRLNGIFTILKENHTSLEESIGFNIKGVKYLFKKTGLPLKGIIVLTNLIDEIVKLYPDWAVTRIKEKFGNILGGMKIDIDLTETEAAC